MRLRSVVLGVMSILALEFGVQAAAHAGPLKAPELKQGRFVYTVPDGFDPPGIGTRTEEIQKAAAALKYPFYVVLAETLPLENDDSDEDEAAAEAVNGLADDFAKQPGYDVGKSSVFLLTYAPRKYRFVAGATWRQKFGFERDAHKPYLDLFVQAVSGTPKDPAGGIIAVMGAVDDYLVDQTDPARIAARKAAQEKAERERKLNDALTALRAEIKRSRDLLGETPYLPADVSEINKALQHAEGFLRVKSAESIAAQALALKGGNDTLEQFILKRKSEEFSRNLNRVLTGLFALLLLAFFGGWTMFRRRRHVKARKRFEKEIAAMETRISNAQANYMRFYSDRDSVVGLKSPAGKTAELYASVTSEIDSIYSAICAMEKHVARCKQLGNRGSYLNIAPFEEAVRLLRSPFTFDTGELNTADLFAPATKKITVRPDEFSRELEDRFKSSIDGWDRLKAACQSRFVVPREAFPHSALDAMMDEARTREIPLRWLQDHPLAGDDESDARVWQNMDVLRLADPIGYLEKLEELKGVEAAIRVRLDGVIESLDYVARTRAEANVAVPEGIELDPKDDPRITLDEARRSEAKLTALLASTLDQSAVEKQASSAGALYVRSVEQMALLARAREDAWSAIEKARTAMTTTVARSKAAAVTAYERAHTVFRNTLSLKNFIADGDRFAESARHHLEKADRQFKEQRFLNALRTAGTSHEDVDKATQAYDRTVKEEKRLQEGKAAYERRLAGMESQRAQYERRMGGYGRHAVRLDQFQRPANNGGLLDYVALSTLLDSQESAWEAQDRRARRAYEAEQAEIQRRADEERREREAQEAEERRRASYAASTWSTPSYGSSDSGGSWGSSYDSSSGGSWGGGGDSSSGGSW